MRSDFPLMLVLSAALALSACFDSENDDKQSAVDDSTSNQAPTISGSPPTDVLEGQLYEFTPVASDPDGGMLEFTISRKPSWASFDRATGRLSGTPDSEDVGNFTNIGISVSDGTTTATLIDFDVTVNQIALGSATLSWTPPTHNGDGSVLTDLVSYRIYYGRNRDHLTEVVVLENPGLTRYVVENLTPAQWFFAMTSRNSQGVESQRSGIASKTIG